MSMSMRTWAPTTPNVQGVASSLGCGTTVRAACGRGLATQLGRACGRSLSSSLGVQSACSARINYGSATFSDAAQSEEENPVIGLESLRCRWYIASGEENVRRQLLFFSATVWLASRVLTRVWTQFGGGAGTSMAMRTIPVARMFQLCGRSLRGSTVGFQVWPLLVNTSAAWSRTHSTKWVQRNDACSACFAACAGKKSNVVISLTLSLLPTSSACRNSDHVFAF